MMKFLKRVFKRKRDSLHDQLFKVARENQLLKANVDSLMHDNGRLDALWAKTTADLLAEEAKVRDLDKTNEALYYGKEHAESCLYVAEHRIRELTAANDASRAEMHRYQALLAVRTAPESKLAAFVMSLRVHEMKSDSLRGYGVTAFIPNGVLDAISTKDPETKATFVNVIASELVARALRGMWYINSRGARSALVFDPVSGGAAGSIFDTPNGPEMKLARAKGEARNTLQLLSQRPEAAEKLHTAIAKAETDEEAWLREQPRRTTLPVNDRDKADAIKLMIASAQLPREAGDSQ